MADVEVVAEIVKIEGEPDDAVVQPLPNGWHLITYGNWQVSVSPDGLIRLPHSVLPDTVDHLVGALQAAAGVGAQVRADNEANAHLAPPGVERSRGGLVVTAGPPPAGSVRLPFAPRG